MKDDSFVKGFAYERVSLLVSPADIFRAPRDQVDWEVGGKAYQDFHGLAQARPVKRHDDQNVGI
jgi:hypothetical protein